MWVTVGVSFCSVVIPPHQNSHPKHRRPSKRLFEVQNLPVDVLTLSMAGPMIVLLVFPCNPQPRGQRPGANSNPSFHRPYQFKSQRNITHVCAFFVSLAARNGCAEKSSCMFHSGCLFSGYPCFCGFRGSQKDNHHVGGVQRKKTFYPKLPWDRRPQPSPFRSSTDHF